MTDREELVKLLHDGNRHCRMVECRECEYFTKLAYCKDNIVADHLIAHGVTVWQWISVEDRLPECKQDVLMYFDTGNMAAGFWHDGDETITFWCAYTDDGWFTDCDCEPLYWMPLPEPPKEE